MKIKPIGNRILVQNIKSEKKTSTGLIIPEDKQEKTQKAVVVAIGNIDINVDPENIILYEKNNGTEIKIDGVDYVILKTSDVIAILE